MKKRDWKKNAPDKVGWWLRMNAVHRPECHWVFEDYRNTDKALCVDWGWSGEKKSMRIKDNLHKIEHFYWAYFEVPERDKQNSNR